PFSISRAERIDDVARITVVGRRVVNGEKGLGGRGLEMGGLEEPSIRVTAVQQHKQATSSRSPPVRVVFWAEGTRADRGLCSRGSPPPCSRRPLHPRARDVRSIRVTATSAPRVAG